MGNGVDAGSIFSEVRIKLDLLKQDIASVEAEFDKFGTKNKEQSTKVEQDWSKGFNAASIAGVAAFVAIGAAVKSAIGVFAEFDDSMAQVRAVMSGSESDFANLEDAALKLGSTTHFSAKEGADALYEFSKMGKTATESVELLAKAELLAGATGSGLVESSQLLVRVMSQFGLGMDQTDRIVNVLAAAKMSVQEFGNTLSVIGPVAAGMGIPLENVIGILKVLTRTGMESGQATMSLKMILGELSDSTSATIKKLEALGISYNQLNPATNSFAQIIGNLKNAGIGAEQAMATFGNRAGPVMVTLLAQGQKGIEDYTKSITGTDTAAEMYEKRNSTLADSMKEVGNAFDVSSGKIIKEFAPAMETLLGFLKDAINWIGNLPGPFKVFIGIVALGIPVVLGIAAAVQILGTVLTASAGIISLVVVGVAAMAAVFSALPHLIDPVTIALDQVKAQHEAWKIATDNLNRSLEILNRLNKELTDSTLNLTDAERKNRENRIAMEKQNVLGTLEKQMNLLNAMIDTQANLKKQMEDNFVSSEKMRKSIDEGGSTLGKYANAFPKQELDRLSNAYEALSNAQIENTEDIEKGIDAMAREVQAGIINIDVIKKQGGGLYDLIVAREKAIQAEDEQAKKEKAAADAQAERDQRAAAARAKYKSDLDAVNQILETQKSELDKLYETLAKLEAIRLKGNDEIARQKAIVVVTAKIKEEEEKLAKAREKSNAMLDEYKQKFADLYSTQIEGIENQRQATLDSIDKTKTGWIELVEAVNKYYDALIDKTKREEVDNAIKGTWNTAVNLAQQGTSAISDLISAIGEARIADLDRQLQAELEAAGVAEDTAVEKAQKELDIAKETGDAKTIKEKEDALTKAKIEEEYTRKKDQINYQSEKAAWEMQLVMATVQAIQAALNAYSSASAIPIIGWALGPAAAAVAGVFGAIQVAAIAANPPQPPSYETGGIVLGNSFSGDRVPANVNSGEMILTAEQQAQLFAIANGGGGVTQKAIKIYAQFMLDTRVVAEGVAECYEGGTVRLRLS